MRLSCSMGIVFIWLLTKPWRIQSEVAKHIDNKTHWNKMFGMENVLLTWYPERSLFLLTCRKVVTRTTLSTKSLNWQWRILVSECSWRWAGRRAKASAPRGRESRPLLTSEYNEWELQREKSKPLLQRSSGLEMSKRCDKRNWLRVAVCPTLGEPLRWMEQDWELTGRPSSQKTMMNMTLTGREWC